MTAATPTSPNTGTRRSQTNHRKPPPTGTRSGVAPGITYGIIDAVPMTLRLTDDEADTLRRRADLEGRSMQDIARQAIREYVEFHSRADLLDQVLDQEIPRYAEALRRLGE
jgi:predicted transcriptional regulator